MSLTRPYEPYRATDFPRTPLFFQCCRVSVPAVAFSLHFDIPSLAAGVAPAHELFVTTATNVALVRKQFADFTPVHHHHQQNRFLE